jgi:hypothetical protein
VVGYGSTKATGTITQAGQPSNNQTVTVNGQVYTFKTALTPAAGEVFIGATAAVTLVNLMNAMEDLGVRNTNYGTGTVSISTMQVITATATVLTLEAYTGGTGGNALTLATNATNYTVSGATLTGGAGSDTAPTTPWTKSFTGTNGAVFRQAAGNQFYMLINDQSPGAGLGKEARVFASEACTAYSATAASSTNLFPTAAQKTNGLFWRKSTSLDQVNRPWIVIHDDRTAYFFLQTGDTSPSYWGFMFGDIYSLLSGDGFRTMHIAKATENDATVTDDGLHLAANANTFTAQLGTYIAREYTGTGGALQVMKTGDIYYNGLLVGAGQMTYPNPVDGGIYASRVRVRDTAGIFRGYLRGFYDWVHPVAGVIDGDTFTGASGDYSGKSFLVIKQNPGVGVYLMETSNTWDTST